MFSGIRSLLFNFTGTTTDQDASETVQSTETNTNLENINNEKSIRETRTSSGTDILNAATTLFTEQLIVPPRPSIEQLQASSHQLLPSLTEDKCEEDQKLKVSSDSQESNEENNEGFELDDESWELLDFNEKNDLNTSQAVVSVEDEKYEKNLIDNRSESSVQNLEASGTCQKEDRQVTANLEQSSLVNENEVDPETSEASKAEPKKSNEEDNDDNDKVMLRFLKHKASLSSSNEEFPALNQDGTAVVKASSNLKMIKANYAEMLKKTRRTCQKVSWSTVDDYGASVIHSAYREVPDYTITSILEARSQGKPKVVKETPVVPEVKRDYIEDYSIRSSYRYYHPNEYNEYDRCLDYKGRHKKRSQGYGSSRSYRNKRSYISRLGFLDTAKEHKHRRRIYGCDQIEESKSLANEWTLQPDEADAGPSIQSESPIPECSPNQQLTSYYWNDSSDLSEMDESWFVTPPPCFTGKQNVNFKNSSEDENFLIEHPSAYFSDERIIASMEADNERAIRAVYARAAARAKLEAESKKDDEKLEENKNDDEDENEDDDDDDDDDMRKLVTPDIWKSRKNKPKKPLEGSWCNFDSDETDDDFDDMFGDKAEAQVATPDHSQEVIVFDDYENKSDISSGEDSIKETATLQVLGEREYKTGRSGVVVEQETAKKPTTQVRPIQPEKQPSWQLRRKRANRRSLSGSSSSASIPKKQRASGLITRSNSADSGKKNAINENRITGHKSSVNSSISSPSLIDRIGSSIFANLTNLANGLTPSPPCSLGTDSRSAPDSPTYKSPATNETKLKVSQSSELNRHVNSTNQMNRHNNAVMTNNRRPDRRTKMHKYINGVSINRKVQTNFR